MRLNRNKRQSIVTFNHAEKTFVIDFNYMGKPIKHTITLQALNESFAKAKKRYAQKL